MIGLGEDLISVRLHAIAQNNEDSFKQAPLKK